MKNALLALAVAFVCGCLSPQPDVASQWDGPPVRANGAPWDGNVCRTNIPVVVIGGDK